MSMSVFAGLEPAAVWKHFEKICSIPHPSHHEEGIAEYVISEAKRLGLEWRRDEIGNVLVVKPATPGKEAAPVVVLQGHMDMVPVAAPGVEHDFEKDPIRPVVDGEYVRAQGTTLGADNGIGMALMLAVMEDDFPHGKLEFLFTINEEAGMDGAHNLQAEFLEGRTLINLDSEEWGEFTVSCAGGGDSVITFPVIREAADPEARTLQLTVGGLKGGHSGVDINLGRGSGTKIIARLLDIARLVAPVRLRRIQGGNKRNSIADAALAELDVAPADEAAVRQVVESLAAVIKEELATTDPGLTVSISSAAAEAPPLSAETTNRLIDLLVALPHGVLAMSPAMPGLVETSTNLGVIETAPEQITITMLTRSAVTSALPMVKRRIRIIAELAGASVHEPQGYPGWKPNMDSPLLKTAVEVFKRLHGKEPVINAIHAGLECGLFSEKLPGVDMLSLGPEMHNVHSPDEELHHPSVAPTYELIKEIIRALS
jgi:dipeptidase D